MDFSSILEKGKYYLKYYLKYINKFYILFLILFFFLNLYIIIKYSNFKNNIKINEFKLNFKNNLNYSSDVMELYINHQKEFCNYPNKYYEKIYEDQITLGNFSLKELSYKIFIYKKYDHISKMINKNQNYEGEDLLNCLYALKYYATKNNIINNKDIYILDIGGNIGVYPSYLGRYGYSILSFEPSPRNYYISKKNYCLNNNSNIIIINKGLSTEEKICDYYYHIFNIGNGIILCNKFKNKNVKKNFFKIGKVYLTKLNNFIPYLSNKNIALIKIDIEGGEGNAIESGIDLITKYHIPFIIIEFTPVLLKEHNTDPLKLLKLFTKNGYRISLNGFLSNSFISIKEILETISDHKNLYFIYKPD